jgi:hypothetical protein
MSRTNFLREVFTEEDLRSLARAMDRGSRAVGTAALATARERIMVGVTLSVAAIEKLNSDSYAIVPEHIFRTILARLHQVATDGLPELVDGAVVDSHASLEDELPDGVEVCAPGVWVHDDEAPHPCEYACGAIYVERKDEEDNEGDIVSTFKVEAGTWKCEL